MFFRNYFNFINEFYFILKNQIRKIYLSSSLYNKKISKIDENILVYQPSLKILSSLIKYEKQKKEFTKHMDVSMKAVVEELLTIEDRQQTESNQTKEKTYKGGNKKRHLWSDVMAKKTKIHKMLIALLKQSRKKEKRKERVGK